MELSQTAYAGRRDDVVAALVIQADWCDRLGSPMYAALLRRAADDVQDDSSPVLAVMGAYAGPLDRDAVALRMMGAVHRLVLQRRAGALAVHYPSVGGTFDETTADAAWRAMRDVLVEHRAVVTAGMSQPPQTNEVGRGAALLGGLVHLGDALAVRLFEFGASAGLNLRADAFRVEHTSGAGAGPDDSPVRLVHGWTGADLPGGVPTVVERQGVDLAPVDPTTTEGRLTLTSYVWADQVERLERLRGAFLLAERLPAVVSRGTAADLVDALELVPGTLTVIWHSVMWQYVSDAEQRHVTDRIEALGAQTTPSMALARLSLEPHGRDTPYAVRLQHWAGGIDGADGGQSRVLGTAVPHGMPVTWVDVAPGS